MVATVNACMYLMHTDSRNFQVYFLLLLIKVGGSDYLVPYTIVVLCTYYIHIILIFKEDQVLDR